MIEDEDDMAERLTAKWAVDVELVAEKQKLQARQRRADGDDPAPMPKRVEVERVEHGFPTYPVWFLYGYDEAGARSHLLDTSNAKLAQSEIARYQAVGIPVTPYKAAR